MSNLFVCVMGIGTVFFGLICLILLQISICDTNFYKLYSLVMIRLVICNNVFLLVSGL